MEEKKKLNLKIKTFADLKRFKSRKVHEIVGKMRESNGKMSKEELNTFKGLVKYAARRSLIRKSDNNKAKQTKKLNAKYNEKKSILNELLENKQITKEQYEKQMEQLRYNIRKKVFEKDFGAKDQEKPKNPAIQRAIKSIGKVAKTVGKGIVTAAKVSASIAVLPFVGLYQGAKFVSKKALAIGRGGKVAALTAGKVVSNTAKAVAENVKGQVEPIATQVKETEEARKNSKNAKTLDEKRDTFENSSKEAQEAIISDDYKAALRENAKRERESARRESLHMDAERQPIDHEEAKKKTFERVDGQELSPEEEKEVYGDEEK